MVIEINFDKLTTKFIVCKFKIPFASSHILRFKFTDKYYLYNIIHKSNVKTKNHTHFTVITHKVFRYFLKTTYKPIVQVLMKCLRKNILSSYLVYN